jgi:hypothetical protein
VKPPPTTLDRNLARSRGERLRVRGSDGRRRACVDRLAEARKAHRDAEHELLATCKRVDAATVALLGAFADGFPISDLDRDSVRRLVESDRVMVLDDVAHLRKQGGAR